jgi:hypothetical protein
MSDAGATKYLMTRARARGLDYDWLGKRPSDRWWDKYGQHTFFEHPTAIVEADSRDWRLYLSGIPSERQDAVGTPIRHSLMLTGHTDDAAEGVRVLAAALVTPQELGRVIDHQFDEDTVARCLAEPGSEWDDVSARLAKAIETLDPETARPQPLAEGTITWAGADSPGGVSGLVAHGAALLGGEPVRGLVALLNLVRSTHLPIELVPAGAAAAFLVPASDAEWQPAPKASPRDSGPQPRPKSRTRLVISVTLAVALAAGVVAYLILRAILGSR